MPVDETTILRITCDYAHCPGGHKQDPTDRTGWIFITGEVYGEQASSAVYGDSACMSRDVRTVPYVSRLLGRTPTEEEIAAWGLEP